uniref:Protein sleepless n=1 Tax=Panagrellus redivivus TaxID=6233 RepID=A0A7E4VLY5_PANRE
MSAIRWRWRQCFFRLTGFRFPATIKLLAGILCCILLNNAVLVDGLRCYAGNPHRKRECTSMSYCLMITAKTGHTQWSCDGNSFTQLSLCQNLGMDAPRHTIYEASASSRQLSAFQGISASAAVNSESTDGSSVYIRSPNEMIHYPSNNNLKEHVDARLGNFVSDVTGTGGSNSYYRNGGGGSPRGSVTPGGKRCFDVGALGRICCCATDYCNGAGGVYSNQAIIGRVFSVFFIQFVFRKLFM